MQTTTATKSSSITNTKLAVATLAALAAGGLALAAAPASPSPGDTLAYCSDSDGKNLDTRGDVTITSPSGTILAVRGDYCLTSSTVQEYFCTSENEEGAASYECRSGICDGGRCVKPTLSCEDSDGGKNTETRGIIELLDERGGIVTSSVDYCLSTSTLNEYFCDGSAINWNYLPCKAGCADGACTS